MLAETDYAKSIRQMSQAKNKQGEGEKDENAEQGDEHTNTRGTNTRNKVGKAE